MFGVYSRNATLNCTKRQHTKCRTIEVEMGSNELGQKYYKPGSVKQTSHYF